MALTQVNLTNIVENTLPVANGGTGSTSTTYCSLTANVTGTLPITNGGTGQTTASAALTALGGASVGKAIAMTFVFG